MCPKLNGFCCACNFRGDYQRPQRPFCLSSVRNLPACSFTQEHSEPPVAIVVKVFFFFFAAIEAQPAPRSPNHPTLALCPLMHTCLTGHAEQTSTQGPFLQRKHGPHFSTSVHALVVQLHSALIPAWRWSGSLYPWNWDFLEMQLSTATRGNKRLLRHIRAATIDRFS